MPNSKVRLVVKETNQKPELRKYLLRFFREIVIISSLRQGC
jgi:hypothetical protein